MRSNRFRTTTLAATALLAALSLTACGSETAGSESAKAGAAAPAAHQAVKQSPPPAATAAPEEKTTDTGGTGSTPEATATPSARSDAKNTTGSTRRTGTGTGTGSTKPDRTPVTCDGGNSRTAVTTVSRPLNHLLLTLTNTGDRPCYAYYAPGLRFDDAQAAFPVLDDSQPQAVVTLDPGQSAYAGIGLAGEPGAGPSPREATRLQVHFSGRSGEGSTGTPVTLTLPSDTYWDDNGFVTYWQTEMADALTY